jgi:hypothetical protein
MNSIISRLVAPILFLAIAAPTSIVLGQEEAPVEETGSRMGNIYFDIGTWVPQPVGLHYTPATLYDTSTGFGVQSNLELPHSTSDKTLYGLEYRMPSGYGRFVASLYKHEDVSSMSAYRAAEFIYGESLAHNAFPGVYNNQLADAFVSTASTRLRQWGLDYYRPAFRTPRLAADWFVGWRRVEHERALAAEYFALVPDLPPILPPACNLPCPDLSPWSDTATVTSDFDGRGITAGIDLEFPLWKNELVFEGKASLTVMRGKLSAGYQGNNSYYILNDGSGIEGYESNQILCLTPESCQDDYEIFDMVFVSDNQVVYVADRIAQREAKFAVGSNNSSHTSQLVDLYLGFRWRTPLQRLEVFAGFRQAHYNDIAVELRPVVNVVSVDDGQVMLGMESLNPTEGSVTYEGFLGGVTVRIY